MRSRLAVAFVTDAIAPFHAGGKEARYRELVGRLAAEFDVCVYTMNWWHGPTEQHDGTVRLRAICPLIPLYQRGRRSIRQALVFAVACFRLLRQDFDILEADHMPYFQLFPLRLVAWLKRKPFVVTWHEVWGRDYWRQYLGRAGYVAWLIERVAMRLPDHIVAASTHTADRLRERLPGTDSISAAPNGIDLDGIYGAVADERAVDVVTVGRLLRHKRVDLLLDALAVLRDGGRPATCRVIGSGPELDNLRAQADRLGLSGQVEFRPDVRAATELFSLVKASGVFVLASEREGFGISVLEGFACGVPVVTTSAPDNLAVHLVAGAPGGVVCQPTPDAVAAAIRSAMDTARGPADLAWLDGYSWDRTTERVAEVFRRRANADVSRAVAS